MTPTHSLAITSNVGCARDIAFSVELACILARVRAIHHDRDGLDRTGRTLTL
jgi:hypothetical protein